MDHPLTSLHPFLGLIGHWLLGIVQDLFERDFATPIAGIRTKRDGTPVGDLDLAIAESCHQTLGPFLQVVTEEDDNVAWPPQDGQPTVLLDPLDGTKNHANGVLDYGSVIALCEKGQVTASAILMPAQQGLASNGLFVAAHGRGAFRFNSATKEFMPLHVSRRSDLSQAYIVFKGPRRTEKTCTERARVIAASRDHRGNPLSAASAGVLVASGEYFPTPGDALFAVDDHPWDNLAQALLIEEAGGKVTDFQGQPWNLTTRNIVAANPTLHAAILAAMHNPKE